MGRPWWYDSYWEKRQPPKRRLRAPGRRFLSWLVVVLLSVFLALTGAGFRSGILAPIVLFVDNFCRILSIAVLVRAVLTWFLLGGYNKFVMVLDDITEPIMTPLRRAIPMIGRFDISPLVAIVILSLIPVLVRAVIL